MSQKLLAAYAVLASALNTAWALPSNTESSTNTVQNRADLSSACAASMNNVIPSPTPSGFVFSGTVRRYYIAAEEIEWDYAPTGWDNWLGVRYATIAIPDLYTDILMSGSVGYFTARSVCWRFN